MCLWLLVTNSSGERGVFPFIAVVPSLTSEGYILNCVSLDKDLYNTGTNSGCFSLSMQCLLINQFLECPELNGQLLIFF